MDAPRGMRSARLEKALVAELLLAGLLLGYSFPLPRVVPLLLLASLSLWMRCGGWVDVGLRRPVSLRGAVLTGGLAALAILVIVRLMIAPFAVWVTGTPIDQSAFEPLRGNVRLLLVSLLLAWTLAAFGEEMVFRGYLMHRLTDLVGDTRLGWVVALVVSSAFFGWAHGYQGPAGMVATGVIGALLGLLYLCTGRNLWPAIVCHAVVDTVALTAVYLGRSSLLFP